MFNHINGNLYHYAGNNPVRYVDPDGLASVTNETDDTIVIKPENSEKFSFALLSSGETYKGDIDGIIFLDGTVRKTWGKSDYVAKTDKNGNYKVAGGKFMDFLGNLLKAELNKLKVELEFQGVDTDALGMRWEDMYGTYQYKSNCQTFLNSWLGSEKTLDTNNDKESDTVFVPIPRASNGGMPSKD